MEDLSVENKIILNTSHLIAKYLPKEIINKIKSIPISITNIEDKITWKLTSNCEFSVRTAT